MKCVMSEVELYQMISELDKNNVGMINFDHLMPFIVDREFERLKGNDESELMDAFVAMGGCEDGSGSVDADILIEIIKNQFAMSIDIEGLIKEIDVDRSGQIEFDEFKELLS